MKTVIDRVRHVIADALYLEVEQVTKDAVLMHGLGAESIDFLDIMFRLEKEFQIKLPKGEIERQARGALSDSEFAVDGKLTPAALERVRAMMPEVDASLIKAGLLARDLPTLFTVATFARMVDSQLFGESAGGLAAQTGSEKAVGSRM